MMIPKDAFGDRVLMVPQARSQAEARRTVDPKTVYIQGLAYASKIIDDYKPSNGVPIVEQAVEHTKKKPSKKYVGRFQTN